MNRNQNARLSGRILVVDDDESIRRYYDALLTAAGLDVDQASSLDELRARIPGINYGAVLLDLRLGEEQGLDGLAWIARVAPFTKVYVLTSYGSIERAVECMRNGAAGFFEKGMPAEKILAELTSVFGPTATVSGDDATQDGARYGLIGVSDAIHETISMVERLKDVDSTVLILGESGTGKEVVARAIHQSSQRGKHRFDAVNCAAIPEALLESELFGHKKGSFTDAKADRKGIFEACSQGTLLLDEIGDMPLTLQVKLLRVLQERQVTPVGASAPLNVDTRVIAATHRDLFFEVKSNNFREDLYYRLSIVVMRIPPLRHRLEDIPVLVQHFLDKLNKRFGREVKTPSHATMSRLMTYDWPGNIRELRNATERAVVLSTDGELTIENMFQHLVPASPPSGHAANGTGRPSFDEILDLPLTEAKQAFERTYLENLLRIYEGSVIEVAEKSGRYRADIYRLLNSNGLKLSDFR